MEKNQQPDATKKATPEKIPPTPAPKPEDPVREIEEDGVDDGRITFERPEH